MFLVGGKRMIYRLKKWFRRKAETMHSENIPQHVAIIMDGNGRWARSRGLPRVAGHHSGMTNVKKIAVAANEMGIKFLTLYAFSTENWKRPKDEVDYLLKLPQEFFPIMIDELSEKNVQIRMTGNKDGLPEHTLKPVQDAIEKTRNNTGLVLNFALNYGSRNEMLQAVKFLVKDVQSGALDVEQLSEAHFSSRLQTKDLPDPDLLIRTSGELRISNFMLWQLAYTELWFTDVYWPSFTEKHFISAIMEYQRRQRRYGGL
jgi:undecaprenyl diphosphate synthase